MWCEKRRKLGLCTTPPPHSPKWPYLWVSDGDRDVYMNPTQTAGTSGVCKDQAANFTRTELFFRGGGVGRWWLRFPVLPVSELLERRQKLYFRISVPGRSWKLRLQMCTKKGHVGSCTHTLAHRQTLGKGHRLPSRGFYLKQAHNISIFSISKKKKRRGLNSKAFHKGLSKFQKPKRTTVRFGGKRFVPHYFL